MGGRAEKRAQTRSLDRKEEGALPSCDSPRTLSTWAEGKQRKRRLKKNSPGVWITTAPRRSQDAEGFPAGPRGLGRLGEHAWWRRQGGGGVSPGWKLVCRACVCTSICDTFEAAGPHSSSGMWDFQVENSTHGGRGEGEGQRQRAERSGSGLIIIIIIPHSAHPRTTDRGIRRINTNKSTNVAESCQKFHIPAKNTGVFTNLNTISGLV